MKYFMINILFFLALCLTVSTSSLHCQEANKKDIILNITATCPHCKQEIHFRINDPLSCIPKEHRDIIKAGLPKE